MNFNFQFNVESLSETLPIMGKGMLGIFVVILLIYILIKVLIKIFPAKNN